MNQYIEYLAMWFMSTSALALGLAIHGHLVWAIINAIFWPVSLVKWLLCGQVNVRTVDRAFKIIANLTI